MRLIKLLRYLYRLRNLRALIQLIFFERGHAADSRRIVIFLLNSILGEQCLLFAEDTIMAYAHCHSILPSVPSWLMKA